MVALGAWPWYGYILVRLLTYHPETQNVGVSIVLIKVQKCFWGFMVCTIRD